MAPFMLPLLFRFGVALGLFLGATSTRAQLAGRGRLPLAEDFPKPAAYTKEFQPAKAVWRARAWHQDWQRTTDGLASTGESTSATLPTPACGCWRAFRSGNRCGLKWRSGRRACKEPDPKTISAPATPAFPGALFFRP
jgi:hypothetical protein